MKLILVRHGDYNPSTIDPEEGLSKDGIEEVKELSRILDQKNHIPNKIYSSPKTRAFQTANLLANESIQVQTTPFLKGDQNPEAIINHIEEEGTILLVGHNPFMGELAALFDMQINFHTAGCIILDNGNLIWSNN